jgi:hypothetical protein
MELLAREEQEQGDAWQRLNTQTIQPRKDN